MTTTLTKLGPAQTNILSVLKDNATGLTAPQIRELTGLPEGDYGTRRAIAILDRLIDLGFVSKEVMSAKVAASNANPKTGRVSKHRFKINGEGKKALKASR